MKKRKIMLLLLLLTLTLLTDRILSHGSEYAKVTQGSKCATVCLNRLFEYAWICMNLRY